MRLSITGLIVGITVVMTIGHMFAKPEKQGYDIENDEIRGAGPKQSVDGGQMKAFLSTYPKFKAFKNLAPEEKRLENYDVGFSKDKRGILVYYTPKPIPGKDVTSVGNENGLPLLFVVDPVKFTVLEYGVLP